jgi:hypothetical protein
MVESPSLLATTRDKPSWRDFDTRAKPDGTSNEMRSPRECVPLLGAPQRVR